MPTTFNRPMPHHTGYCLLLSFLWSLLCVCHAAQADQKQAQKDAFKTPAALYQAEMDNRDHAIALLETQEFNQQLVRLAQQLDDAVIQQQNMFNKVALLSVLGRHRELLDTLAAHPNGISYSHFRLDSQTQLQLSGEASSGFEATLTTQFQDLMVQSDNKALYQLQRSLGWSVERAQDYVFNVFKGLYLLSDLDSEQAISLIVNSHLLRVLTRVIPVTRELLGTENKLRYDITPELLIHGDDGVEIAATIVKPKQRRGPMATAMQFTIYADEAGHILTAINAAAHGYIGVVANSRGKRSSTNPIAPWEKDGEDATTVIDWISKQSWSDGRVVMYGGSYNGFTQWAATKHMHPALKAIAPYAAASPITGLPYENNVLLTGNYEWAFFVTNLKTNDHSAYADWEKSRRLLKDLFESGRPSVDIDKIDGKPNPWFQTWLAHPSFDEYYQAMVPVKDEYAAINIPVLTITGYFDGGQISALDYLTRHYRHNPNADHTLLIGPYNHRTAQEKASSHHSNYKLDTVALAKDTEALVFAWFDHLLHNQAKPKLLKNKVNYQLMGSNQWCHADSMTSLEQSAITFYPNSRKDEQGYYRLSPQKEGTLAAVSQTVDLADRSTEHNLAPWPVIQDALNEPNGLVFLTERFEQPYELAGSITGHFAISINKKDVDIGYNFYAIDKQGKAFHLNNYRSRASYAHDMGERRLLTPNAKTEIPIVNARMTAYLLEPGSRLAIVLNVNKNKDAQVNMGTGKDVNRESVSDAGAPLEIQWFNDSQLRLPLRPRQNKVPGLQCER